MNNEQRNFRGLGVISHIWWSWLSIDAVFIFGYASSVDGLPGAGAHPGRVEALQSIGHHESLPDHRRNSALEMGDGMAPFCSGMAGHFFNRPGTPWPQADVTILEMGILAREGYEDVLTVAYISMMSHINDLVERHQHDARPTHIITDEGHNYHHISTAGPLCGQDHQDVAQARRLVLDCHPEPRGFSGCQP